ncbi:MAG: RnfABCDGE type electron transport complex subunit D [Planctomycetes bacterium]|nr:RnfABCDGE type electron transport complex subunit D [Planctomycetota bacterium]
MAEDVKDKLLLVSAPPHMNTGVTTKQIMRDVLLALLPAAVWAVLGFGLQTLLVILVAMFTCQFTEWVCNKLMKSNRKRDNSALLTGLLFAFCLPANISLYVVVIGSIFAIAIVKMMFGGIGNNILNPALAARVFVGLSFPTSFSNWIPNALTSSDAITSATPLQLLANAGSAGRFDSMQLEVSKLSNWNLLFGSHSGALGEGAALLLIIGGIYLLWRKIISWHIPITFILSFMVLSFIAWVTSDSGTDFGMANPIYHLLSGGLILGAFFMATDYVTSPITKSGQIVFGIGCCVLTFMIRFYGEYPEGVMYSILFMNLMMPMIEYFMPASISVWLRKNQKEKLKALKLKESEGTE